MNLYFLCRKLSVDIFSFKTVWPADESVPLPQQLKNKNSIRTISARFVAFSSKLGTALLTHTHTL